MKKLLLTLAAVVSLGFAATAEDVTFDFLTDSYGLPNDGSTFVTTETATNGAVSLSFSKTNGSGFRMWNDGLRVYKTNGGSKSGYAAININIENAKVTGVEFTCKTAFTSATVAGEEMTKNGKIFSWTSATGVENPEVQITQTVNNYAMETLTITYQSLGDPSKADADLSFAETNFTANLGEAFTAPTLVNPNGLAVTYSSSEETVATVAEDGKVTLVGEGTTKITASSVETDKFNAGSASYLLTVVKSMTIAEVVALSNNESFVMGTPLTVVYANSSDTRYNYVYADGVYSLVYSTSKLGLKTGDVIIAGWAGKMTYYNGLPELVPAGAVETTGETGTIPTFATVAADEIDNTLVNTPVIVKNVSFAEATPDKTAGNFTGNVGETILKFRNTFKLETVAAGAYDVTCIVSVYESNKTELGTALQFVPITFSATGTVGIEDLEAADNAPVEYFNLQGVRVANPENGLFIRRQGNKVSKMFVK